MSDVHHTNWLDLTSAPRDGTRFLALLKPSQQNEAHVEVIHWAATRFLSEPCWACTNARSDGSVVYAAQEIGGWMPFPTYAPPKPQAADAAYAWECDASGI